MTSGSQRPAIGDGKTIREIWRPGDGNGDSDMKLYKSTFDEGHPSWKIYCGDAPNKVNGVSTEPPKYCYLDDQACYHIYNSNKYDKAARARFWPSDFNAEGAYRPYRKNRGRPAYEPGVTSGEPATAQSGGTRTLVFGGAQSPEHLRIVRDEERAQAEARHAKAAQESSRTGGGKRKVTQINLGKSLLRSSKTPTATTEAQGAGETQEHAAETRTACTKRRIAPTNLGTSVPGSQNVPVPAAPSLGTSSLGASKARPSAYIAPPNVIASLKRRQAVISSEDTPAKVTSDRDRRKRARFEEPLPSSTTIELIRHDLDARSRGLQQRIATATTPVLPPTNTTTNITKQQLPLPLKTTTSSHPLPSSLPSTKATLYKSAAQLLYKKLRIAQRALEQSEAVVRDIARALNKVAGEDLGVARGKVGSVETELEGLLGREEWDDFLGEVGDEWRDGDGEGDGGGDGEEEEEEEDGEEGR